ncbi:hypothetical protein NFG57_11980 [Halomonas sp. H10-59]|uniref:Uncharacterized protein n=1 Tax=Halomonas sp. H10-59 TaxID=2950874 RepID=A0AAU7KP73_9GAMM
MNLKYAIILICLVSPLGGCGAVSSSSVPQVASSEQTVGPIFITQAGLPSDIEYEVIGVVKANARQGYDKAESLYPLLAQEARKVGANAIIEAYGGRTVSAFSWAAPFVGGTAVKVVDPQSLESFDGQFIR